MRKQAKLCAIIVSICMLLTLASCTSTTPVPAASTAPTASAPVVSGAAVAPEAPTTANISPMKPGRYTATVKGNAEGLTVEVVLGEKTIDSVVIKEHKETAGVSDAAISTLPSAIVAAQSIGLDTVAGATYTSNGIFAAVKKTIEEAGGKPNEFMIASATKDTENVRASIGSAPLPATWDMTYDVVVVGGGFAGLAAAHSAKTNGANTILVEKMPALGGNSQINGGVYASYTSKLAATFQKKFNLVPDTAEKHIEDTMKGGDYMSFIGQVKNMVYGAPFYLDMLLDNGLEVRESLTRPGGHYGYRTYTTINGVGADIVTVQKKMVAAAGVEVQVNTKMVEIYRDPAANNAVVGIKVQTSDNQIKNIKATKGVILATGGFSANVEMRSRQVPALTAEVPTTNHVGATGEGITIAQAIGANTMQMSYIQLYPFADPNTGILDAVAVIPFSGPSSGVVYVDINGKRYVNEGERRDVCAKAAQDSAGFPTFCIFNETIVEKGGFIGAKQLADGIAQDRIFKADTLEQLAAEINKRTYKDGKVNMDGATLAATISLHNGYVKNASDPDFGKVIDSGVMLSMETGPYYAVPQWPSVHHTMGGLTVTTKTEVQDIWGEVIPGLFAAGEVTGGVHGTNRLGSNATPDACVAGYIAGQMAAAGTLPAFVPK